MCRAILAGLLTIQSGMSCAATASADLKVAALVSSNCAVSSQSSIPRSPLVIVRRGVRVDCSPLTAFTIASNTRRMALIPTPEGYGALVPAQPLSRLWPIERSGDMLVVEIAY